MTGGIQVVLFAESPHNRVDGLELIDSCTIQQSVAEYLDAYSGVDVAHVVRFLLHHLFGLDA